MREDEMSVTPNPNSAVKLPDALDRGSPVTSMKYRDWHEVNAEGKSDG
jgi:hypothetical protein